MAGDPLKEIRKEPPTDSLQDRYRAFLEFMPDPVFVFNLDYTVAYLNPAFERVFGWTLSEMAGKRIPFVPEGERERTRKGVQYLFETNEIRGFETRRLTKDGRLLDIIIDGAIFFDQENQPAGQVITLRDVTLERRTERTNQALFRIAQALFRFRDLGHLLEFITREVQDLIHVGGASVILLDEERGEFYFPVTAYDDSEAGRKMKEIRFPADKGIAGHVYRTGKPLIVPDTSKSPYFLRQVDEQTNYNTTNMLDVPLRIKDRIIGVLCAVNKKSGGFTRDDTRLLEAIANLVALPIENVRINGELTASYQKVRDLNRAKDQVIHHLSHELKTPLAVLSTSIGLLSKRLASRQDDATGRILERIQRNLKRILEMQYEVEDFLLDRNYPSYPILLKLLDACGDLLETMISQNLSDDEVVTGIRRQIETLFGPRELISQPIDPGAFLKERLDELRVKFAHRRLNLQVRITATPPISIPPEVLGKIIDGLIRNSVEYTPDGGKIEVTVRQGEKGPLISIKDYGVGITAEKQRLFFGNFFISYETLQYSSKKPYDFDAGGKGFDLLRLKIFSERYGFSTEMVSQRCGYIPKDEDKCPGDIQKCRYCKTDKECYTSGYTIMRVQFGEHP